MEEEPTKIAKPPLQFTAAEREAFAAMVRSAGEVGAGLPELIEDAVALVMMYAGDELIGTAGIKRPRQNYRGRVFRNSETDRQATDYPVELGWIAVAETYQGRGLSSGLVDSALAWVPAGQKVYATARTDNTRIHGTLERRGFVRSGTPYDSKEHKGEKIELHLRDAPAVIPAGSLDA